MMDCKHMTLNNLRRSASWQAAGQRLTWLATSEKPALGRRTLIFIFGKLHSMPAACWKKFFKLVREILQCYMITYATRSSRAEG